MVCDCPDYIFHREGSSSLCKHGRALIEAGYLDRPSPVANPSPAPDRQPCVPAAAPVTSADRKRASYFGLSASRPRLRWSSRPPAPPKSVPAKLPAPMVVEAPAPVVAVVAELLPVEANRRFPGHRRRARRRRGRELVGHLDG